MGEHTKEGITTQVKKGRSKKRARPGAQRTIKSRLPKQGEGKSTRKGQKGERKKRKGGKRDKERYERQKGNAKGEKEK